MRTIRQQAKAMGHDVVGTLKRIADDVFTKDGEEIRNKMYVDNDGTVYAVNWRWELVYIVGEDWVL